MNGLETSQPRPPSGIRRLWIRLPLALVVAASLLTCVVPSAGAIGEYSQPATLSAPGSSILAGPAVAVGPDDRATVAWTRYGGDDMVRVEAVQVDPGGRVSPVRTLAESPDGAWSLDVAVDRLGRATVVWYGIGPQVFGHRISAVQLGADGVPGPVRSFGSDARSPQIVVDSLARATVVWFSGGGNTLNVQATRLDASGAPGELKLLSEPGEGGFAPRVAIGPGDRVMAVWRGDQFAQATRLEADGSAGPVMDLSDPGRYQDLPDVAVDRQDRATVAWQQSVPPEERETSDDWSRVKFARVEPDGGHSPAQTLSGPGPVLGVRVETDNRDRAVVAWVYQPWRIGLARIGADGVAEPARTIGSIPGGFVGGPALSTDRSGGATVAWDESTGQPTAAAVKAVHVGADGLAGAPQVLSVGPGPYSSPSIVTDSQNNVLAAWARQTGDNLSEVQLVRGGRFEAPDGAGPPGTGGEPGEPGAGAARRGTIRFGRRGLLRGGRIVLRARCSRHGPCSGRLRVLGRRGSERSATSARRILARGRYHLAAGAAGRVRIRLTRHWRPLPRSGSRRARLVWTAAGTPADEHRRRILLERPRGR